MIVYKVAKPTNDPRRFHSAILSQDQGGLTYTIGRRKTRRFAPMLVFATFKDAEDFIYTDRHRFAILECEATKVEDCPGITRWGHLRPRILPLFWRWLLDPERKPNDETFYYWGDRRWPHNFYLEPAPRGTLMAWELTPIRVLREAVPDKGGTP